MRRLRSAAGLTQEEFAARCFVLGFEISGGGLSYIETGVRGVSDLEMALLARALRVPLGELVPARLPKWRKDLRPPTATAGE